ncbi:hypothetical protein P153DRAFT_25907 [Dothidotthia symphoricarpi CBS 119687]|uniref:Uncharacterized protein n=1 Tax=Dothidotthia symphoricarpi CBS 119687 TaxID=1392245 RepID=A0A6A6ACT6_9PLEO|nr:uncharacterized protein P153DRAFT_25907 [Dothidotthia symphoricarpi CBS 119687]KAF2128794.1 hypothetical protein P153DRAFT_25907 [Dothidotthia symphoricarpi CBS 119687]
MLFSQLCRAVMFGRGISAMTSQQDRLLNLTTTVSSEAQAVETESIDPAPWSTWADGDWNWRPHLEASETAFDSASSTSRADRLASEPTPAAPAVETILEGFFSSILPTVHLEISATGWETEVGAAPTAPRQQNLEPQETEASSGYIIDVALPPPITHNGVTLRPVPVTSTATVTVGGGFLMPSVVVDVQYAAGSSVLPVGTPVVIENAVIELQTDSSGFTVLVADDTTTTLSTQTVPDVQAAGSTTSIEFVESTESIKSIESTKSAESITTTAPIHISTTVIDGTTEYVFAGQTLAPDHPVTVGDIPISIATKDGSTVLFMGNLTTTFVGGRATTPASASGSATITTSTSGRVTSLDQRPASTTSNARGSNSFNGVLGYVAMTAAIILSIY